VVRLVKICWVVQTFYSFGLTTYGVWEKTEREGLKLDALIVVLEVVRHRFVDLVKR
jgi:hypothetical protein